VCPVKAPEADKPAGQEESDMTAFVIVTIDHCCGAALAATAEEARVLEEELVVSREQALSWRRLADMLVANDALNRSYAASATPEVLASPAPNRLDLHISRLERHLAALRETRVALNAFYAQLSAQQRQRFDRLFGSQPVETPGEEAISVAERGYSGS
jgi:hypothetical protein